jgi:eukaryotic-like serine/threonine-protein kinase
MPPEPGPFDQYLERRRAATADDRRMLEQLRVLADMAAASSHTTDESAPARSESPADTRDWVPETPAPSKDGRFVIERCLGKGGFGVVHKAYDQERKTHVALKSFIRPGVESVYAFKKEFRVLADLAHPNLVSLYELFADEDSWFIAMELVAGVDFLTYVCGGTAADPDSGSADFGKPATPCDLPRLGRAMTQLGLALAYLHGEGKLHCDIKPSNVLITDEGHLKLVDFGLATDVAPALTDDSQRIRGTPAYVSPEHAAGGRPTAASDWYGVGVMLFEALTGERPFKSTVSQVLEAKQQRTAPTAGSLRSGIPDGLDALCAGLLERDPAARPSDAEVLSALQQIWPASGAASEHAAVRAERAPFVGRQAQIALLDRAFEASMLGGAQTVFLHGASGIGKTALVRRFLGVLRERESDVVVLEGRCSERESVPYKALDSLIDQLSLYLRKLPRAQADALLPRDSGALARLFPVLRRVDAVVELRQRPDQAIDAHELRRRGCAALRDLLARLVDRHPVVIVIDDLQWTDADSAALIADMIFEHEASPLLFIGCYRTEEGATNAALGALLSAADAARRRRHCEVQTASVDELSVPEAYELADTLTLKHRATAAIDSIVKESGRSPFFINQLIHYSAMTPAAGTPALDAFPEDASLELTLDSVIRARAARFGDGARRATRWRCARRGSPARESPARRSESRSTTIGSVKRSRPTFRRRTSRSCTSAWRRCCNGRTARIRRRSSTISMARTSTSRPRCTPSRRAIAPARRWRSAAPPAPIGSRSTSATSRMPAAARCESSSAKRWRRADAATTRRRPTWPPRSTRTPPRDWS